MAHVTSFKILAKNKMAHFVFYIVTLFLNECLMSLSVQNNDVLVNKYNFRIYFYFLNNKIIFSTCTKRG